MHNPARLVSFKPQLLRVFVLRDLESMIFAVS